MDNIIKNGKIPDRKICIVGAGGFGREVLSCLIDIFAESENEISKKVCFLVGDEFYLQSEMLGVPVIKQSDFEPDNYLTVVALGDPLIRKKIVESLPADTKYATIIHPTAAFSKWIEVGEGSIIAAGVIITCNIKIGRHAHLNLQTTVGHDCEIGDYFTCAPAVNISGNCKCGDMVYFGTNACVRNGVSITNNVTIGMGSVVIKDILEEGIYIGNPLKKMEKK
jgi:sugar O-acyltransferase (sialic acid O-acetyltransferase NeuD family)